MAARSVWILYPGSEFRFYAEDPKGAVIPNADGVGHRSVDGAIAGVGAIPLQPSSARAGEGIDPAEATQSDLAAVVARLVHGPRYRERLNQ